MNRRETAGLVIGLVILVAVTDLAYWSLDAAAQALSWASHAHEVLELSQDVTSIYGRAVAARRSFVIAGDASQLDSLVELDGALSAAEARLEDALASDRPQLARAKRLFTLMTTRLGRLQAAVDKRKVDGKPGTDTAEDIALTTETRNLREELQQEVNRGLTQRDGDTRANVHRTQLAEVFGTLATLLFVGIAFVRLWREVEQRRRSEEELRQTAEGLRIAKQATDAANRELESFSYSVAHDLRAPLRAIDGFSQALQEDVGNTLDASSHDHLRRVRSAAQRMGQLIDALLDLARVTRRELTCETVDLSKLARETGARLQDSNPARKVRLKIQDGLMAQGDPKLLGAAFDNLLGNAWKFTAQRPQAEIEVGRRIQDGVTAFFVKDNGVGFDPAHTERLFCAFQRLHRPQEYDGFGIGLATVDRIVRRHGGRIWADSAVDRGAAFYFTL